MRHVKGPWVGDWFIEYVCQCTVKWIKVQYLCIHAGVRKLPYSACIITQRAHNYVWLAHLLSAYTHTPAGFTSGPIFYIRYQMAFQCLFFFVYWTKDNKDILNIKHWCLLILGYSHERTCAVKGQAIQEHHETNNRSRNQEKCVPAQPQEIQSHLLTKIVSDNTHIKKKKKNQENFKYTFNLCQNGGKSLTNRRGWVKSENLTLVMGCPLKQADHRAQLCFKSFCSLF